PYDTPVHRKQTIGHWLAFVSVIVEDAGRVAAPVGGASLIFKLAQGIKIGGIGRVRNYLGITLFDQPGVDKDIAHVDIAQQPPKAIRLADIAHERHRLAGHQISIGAARFAVAGFVALRRVHTDIAHAHRFAAKAYINSVAIHHVDHDTLLALPRHLTARWVSRQRLETVGK